MARDLLWTRLASFCSSFNERVFLKNCMRRIILARRSGRSMLMLILTGKRRIQSQWSLSELSGNQQGVHKIARVVQLHGKEQSRISTCVSNDENKLLGLARLRQLWLWRRCQALCRSKFPEFGHLTSRCLLHGAKHPSTDWDAVAICGL